MSHLPVDHPMRPFYRFLSLLAGVYTLVFGIVAAAQTHGTPAFSTSPKDHAWALGLRANFGFAIISVVAGLIIVLAALVGRNVDRLVNIWGGLAFCVVGMAMLALMQTTANFLAFSMANVVVSFVIGTILFSAGLYGKTRPIKLRRTAPAASPVEA